MGFDPAPFMVNLSSYFYKVKWLLDNRKEICMKHTFLVMRFEL